MSTDKEKVESQQESISTEETTSDTSEVPTKEETSSEQPTQQTDKTEISTQQEILQKLLNLQEEQSQLIKSIRDENEKLKTELREFKEETEKDKPLIVKAIVKGKYDIDESIKKMGHKNWDDYMAHCRKIYDRINSSYPTINNLHA